MKYVKLPLSKEKTSEFRAGDALSITGEILVARDLAHKRLLEDVERKQVPVDLEGAFIYYCGPTSSLLKAGVGSAGPTTSSRMDEFASKLYDLGVMATIGKGPRSPQVVESIKRNRALYLVAVGGAGAYLGQFIRHARVLAYDELGPEAFMSFDVVDFPVWVAIDQRGDSIFPYNDAG
ncbi:MAG: FumA C-terminus/TtdB family hydratase beta subunit [Actinobacteria bacterium]|nr:FumA C-terminus/TtdB family hydratase beta subunit [Actinomycetota bacterium]